MTSPPQPPPAGFRRTRFVCISDTHNQTRNLPAGDVLIHAGDLTNQGSLSELRKTIKWIEDADYEVKIVVAGNHDLTLDKDSYAEYGLYHHNQSLQDPDACQALLRDSPTVTYLNHESCKVVLRKPGGPGTTFTVFGSPYSPAESTSGKWAFQYEANQASRLWEAIPLDADVVVTHTPPKNHCDGASGGPAGCEALRRALWRVRPKLAVCGHVHGGRGVERVRWRIDLPRCPYLEESTTCWTDPGAGNQKLSRVDLSWKGGRPLDNREEDRVVPVASRNRVSFEPPPACEADSTSLSTTAASSAAGSGFHVGSAAQALGEEEDFTPERLSRLDDRVVSVLQGRMGRKETCVVNAAIMASSYGGPKRFNKAIVVDVDLPVWQAG